MKDEPYRAGILWVTETLIACKGCLPAEHRVAAVADVPGMLCKQWLIEGPMMPEVPASGDPLPVTLLFQTEVMDVGYRVTAWWSHAVHAPWHVGDWPDAAAFASDWGLDRWKL